MTIKKKLKKGITDVSKKNSFIRNIVRKLFYIKRLIVFKIRTIGVDVEENKVIFGCFNGRSYCDSPKAIYNSMLKDPKYKDYKFVWVFKHPSHYKELESNINTTVICSHGKRFEKELASAKYWFFNYKIPEHLYPSNEQVFTQCWHGTPLKRLGCDLEHFDNALNSLKEIKKRYKIEAKKFSYFLSPSKFATEKFKSIWNLEEIGKGDIVIEKGYPRNDFLYNYTLDDIKRIKEQLEIENVDKKIILYAPTYRDNQHTSGVGYTYKTEVDFDKLQKELSDEYIILFRAHWLVANNFDFNKYEGFIYNVSDYDDINELYVIADMLITDYSSVFFDYANLKRPIIFYMYDLEEYRDNLRGFYLNLKELPGSIIKNESDLIKEIKDLPEEFVCDEKYKKFSNKFNYLDDGHASERVLKEIINNEEN